MVFLLIIIRPLFLEDFLFRRKEFHGRLKEFHVVLLENSSSCVWPYVESGSVLLIQPRTGAKRELTQRCPFSGGDTELMFAIASLSVDIQEFSQHLPKVGLLLL